MTVAAAPKKVWTILELLQWGTAYLSDKGFDESRLTIELLLSHVLQLKRIQLYTNFEKPLTDGELAAFKSLLQRRLGHEPLQYITGKTEFMGREFSVDRRALIPRPETEDLVERALGIAREEFGGIPLRVLDIGTGCGCIAVSFAAMVEGSAVTAIDVSAGALELALSNAARNNVSERITFSSLDILSSSPSDFPVRFHLVLSNPPYVSAEELRSLQPEVRDFEPSSSLTDGGDGLSFFRSIALRAKSFLAENGAVIVEHAADQREEVGRIFRQAGWDRIEEVKDYSGNDRCLVARLSPVFA